MAVFTHVKNETLVLDREMKNFQSYFLFTYTYGATHKRIVFVFGDVATPAAGSCCTPRNYGCW